MIGCLNRPILSACFVFMVLGLISSCLNGESPPSVLGQEPTNTNKVDPSRFLIWDWPNDGSIEVDCEVEGVRRSGSGQIDSYAYRVHGEFFESGSVRERIFDLANDDSEFVFPQTETMGNYQHLVTAHRSPDLSLGMHINPSQSHRVGYRVSGHFLPIGLTAAQSENEWNIFKIIKNAGYEYRGAGNGNEFELWSAETEIGHVRIAGNHESGQLESVAIVASEATEMYFGKPLEESRFQNVTIRYYDFSYAPAASDLIGGLTGYRVSIEAKLLTGQERSTNLQITIKRLSAIADRELFPFKALGFVNQVDDGTPIDIVGNDFLRFEVREGRVANVVETHMESQLSDAVSMLKKRTITYQSSGSVSVFLVLKVLISAIVLVSCLISVFRKRK